MGEERQLREKGLARKKTCWTVAAISGEGSVGSRSSIDEGVSKERGEALAWRDSFWARNHADRDLNR